MLVHGWRKNSISSFLEKHRQIWISHLLFIHKKEERKPVLRSRLWSPGPHSSLAHPSKLTLLGPCVTCNLSYKCWLVRGESVFCIQTQSWCPHSECTSKTLRVRQTQLEKTRHNQQHHVILLLGLMYSKQRQIKVLQLSARLGMWREPYLYHLRKFASILVLLFFSCVRVLMLYMKSGELNNSWTRVWLIQLGQLPSLK